MCGANVFALNEPDREPAYRAPNDRVLKWAAEAPDRLFPFVRLSLDEDPLGEAERCLDRGARGIKLHPRAQAFRVNDPKLEAVFALAHERRLPVLIHAGRGLPPGMPLELGHVAERHPDASLILAHAAIVAQAGIGKLARSVENIFFDSSTWTPLDQLNLLSLRAAGADPVGLRHPVRRAARRAQRLRALGARRAEPATSCCAGCCATTRSACSRAGAPRVARRRSPTRSSAPRTRASAPRCIWRAPPRYSGWACRSTSDIWASPRPRCTRRASTSRPSSCAAPRAVWNQWAETLVPGAPPDLVGRGRVWRLLNQAQADAVLA